MTLSIIIPVYKNAESLIELMHQLDDQHSKVENKLEVIFVVDGSPDLSYSILNEYLPKCNFNSQLLLLSRNFGSFSAIRAGLAVARGEFFAVMAADLQEPVNLPFQFYELLKSNQYDIVIGQRNHRADPFLSILSARLFWFFYRKFVQKEMPPGGIDVFGCNRVVRDKIIQFEELNTTLVGLLLWIGFRRTKITYNRLARTYGKSSWSFRRKFKYLLDSCFAFSDLPIRFLSLLGICGISCSIILGSIIIIAKLRSSISIPGYSALAVLILFFGGVNSLGLGILGEYLWRTFENTKKRPSYIIFKKQDFWPSKES